MAELSFEEAVNSFMEKIHAYQQDDEYYNALDTVVYLWDQERVDQLNKAVMPTPMLEIVQPGELYMLVRVRPLRYLRVRRDMTAAVIDYV